ncbi:allograft inflammatory factor 1-like isoform X2 [Mauremys reevesii]|uniref:allograft inflammatory factor 1-like isoform X2 n=1 Tax=Mauremys reevesii TaxID=260615 RepID=UPI00193FE15D|nr:allograft inflammatory factor 1-like isoform X2 [Mauremys reevesii]
MTGASGHLPWQIVVVLGQQELVSSHPKCLSFLTTPPFWEKNIPTALLSMVQQEFLCDPKFSDEEDLEEKLAVFKDLMSVKRMMEKLGAPKTHLELKKMISEVTGGVSETISYQDFVNVMLGKRSAVLKLVMLFEGKANENIPKPSGPPPERDIASLP